MTDSPPDINRLVVTTDDQQSRGGLRGAWDSLAARFSQSVETSSRQPAFGVHRGGVDRVRPAEDLSEYRKIPETTPIVRKALTDFASDVAEPGYRIESDNDDVREYLEEEWCPQAAIIGGEKHNDLLPLLRLFVYERWRGGDALAENVRADPTNADSPITGLHLLNPEHVEFVTYEDKNILVDPDPDIGGDDSDAPMTQRDEAAAYIQYGDGALISSDRDAVKLSQNDVTRSALDPAAGELRGTPVTETIAEDVAGFKNILRDKEEAIKTKAYGLWSLGFGRDTFEYTERDPQTGELVEKTEIIEWSDEGQDEVAAEIEDQMGPGSILTHDGVIELDRLDGEVPDLIDDLQFYVSQIVSPLPTPKFKVGFEQNINQFVTESQNDNYDRLVGEEREELERVFSDLMRRVVDHNLVNGAHDDAGYNVSEVPEDLRFKVEPPEDDSPVLSLSKEEIEKMQMWAQAFDDVRGDLPVDMFVDPEQLLTLILQLPDDAVPELEEMGVDEEDPAVQEMVEEMIDGAGDADADDDVEDGGLPELEADD